MQASQLKIVDYYRARSHMVIFFDVDGMPFTTSIWLPDLDLFALEQKYGFEFMEYLYLHFILLEAMKLTIFRPKTINLGKFDKYHTPEFEQLWSTIFINTYSEWRYLNDFYDYQSPQFTKAMERYETRPITAQIGATNTLCFSGGGKDSLVNMKLLERFKIPYSAFVSSHPLGGTSQSTHALNTKLLKNCNPQAIHRQMFYDDIVQSPITTAYPEFELKKTTGMNMEGLVFQSLLYVLQYGYETLLFGNEKSADEENFIWGKTGDKINHQWCKSTQGMELLQQYINANLITNVNYFSPLKPIYDPLIYCLLSEAEPLAISATFSCNGDQKPWCRKCPKCAYVLLNYLAYLPTELSREIVYPELLDSDINLKWYHEELGLGGHKPFECIGTREETILAFELCVRRGFKGKAIEMYKKHFPSVDLNHLINTYLKVDLSAPSLPQYRNILSYLSETGERHKKALLSYV
uniref:UDP-N-acetyl-alpha-D-muramoyl-L-alanyl-L-glutamate epimerase n=1 Tax=Candidatus Kentrum sp. MB TaxID=2138164 RepID=A0A450XUY7_9GAMM|nr:MAG: hypothetical protein BECKMB1821G_GA0114241_10381 [Candidatus Kentron sp. MB]VFK33085.1 MAG: hypothetical protein BECKMB1821I_GA0114274_10401 [Candidatus Kentron sp. MB]VFK76049.1 MAG: hypothetical protein BECKMB1821H_GA0114242_10401 [Candidatus Kentron sp. MB]